ncbi:MAG: hypothetical protein RIQ56_556 [Candidatus Parcubacteria bacterium]
MPSITVLFRREEESWNAFRKRVSESNGSVIVILTVNDSQLLADDDERKSFIQECAKVRTRLRLATKDAELIKAARAEGIRVLDRTSLLKRALADTENAAEALRLFSPHLWRQQLRTQLQTMGLLSLPKLRIWFLIILSIVLFGFVFLRLLPSADIYVWPRRSTISETANIMLTSSGSVNPPSHVRAMPLVPIKVTVRRAVTFDQISKEFIGTSAQFRMTLINKSSEGYSIRKGSRLTNQAGMIFKMQKGVYLGPNTEERVWVQAADEDLYGSIIGERGNVPVGLKWDLPGLYPEERKLIYGENREAGSGGTTAYRTVLKQKDLDVATELLKKELTAAARKRVDQTLKDLNANDPLSKMQLLNYGQLTKSYYYDITVPKELLGQPVKSITAEGSIDFKMFAYDAVGILGMLRTQLMSHTENGKRLLSDTLSLEHLIVHVIDYDDNFTWIKLTVDLAGTEEFVLDPLTPVGAAFGKKVREAVRDQPLADTLRILKNMPEVERVRVSIWPPWSSHMPSLPSHIFIKPEGHETE